MASAGSDNRRLNRARTETLVLLFLGYGGYYFGRTFFASVKPVLIDQYHAWGVNKETLGLVSSVGTMAYAVGKLGNSMLCDILGGRRMFLYGLLGSVVTTAAFGVHAGVAWFLIWWTANRLVQSAGWAGVVKTASRWFPHERYGSVMAVLCLTFVLGDVASKLVYGWMLEHGATWQGVCFTGAAILAGVGVVVALRLRSTPAEVGLPEPPSNTRSVYETKPGTPSDGRVAGLVLPLVRSASFRTVLILAFCLTVVRDTFGEWLPLYLRDVGGLTPGQASLWASLFPLLGAVSVLASGIVSDHLLSGRRGWLMSVMLVLAVGILATMSRIQAGGHAMLAVALAAGTALMTMGPYSFLSGAIAMELGGKHGSATASGLVDGVGYVGGVVSGLGVGVLSERFGWSAAFGAVAAVCAVAGMASVVYAGLYERG